MIRSTYTITLHTPSLFTLSTPHSPTLGEDFLSDLDLPVVNCIVGGAALRSTNFGSIERRGAAISGSDLDKHTQLRIIAEVQHMYYNYSVVIVWDKKMREFLEAKCFFLYNYYF